GRGRPGGAVPGRPLLPPERRPDPPPAARRTAGGHTRARRPLHGPAPGKAGAGPAHPHPGRPGAAPALPLAGERAGTAHPRRTPRDPAPRAGGPRPRGRGAAPGGCGRRRRLPRDPGGRRLAGGRLPRGAARRVRAPADRARARTGERKRGRGRAAAEDRPAQPVPPHEAAGDRPMKACCKTCAVVALIPVSLAGAPLAAQTPTQTEPELPRSVAEHVIAVYNHPSTVRLGGNARLPRGAELTGDVAVLGGTFTVAGTVRGNVVIINGDLRLEPGAHITGGATVVGGIILGLEEATVDGPVEAPRAALRFRRDEGRLTHAPPPSEPAISAGRQFGFGRTDLRLAVRGAYNRVEGLPI